MRLRYSSLYLAVASLAPKSPSLATCATSLCAASWPLLLLCPLGAGDWTQCFCACHVSVLLLSWTCPQPCHDLLCLSVCFDGLNFCVIISLTVFSMKDGSCVIIICSNSAMYIGTCKYLWSEIKCLRIWSVLYDRKYYCIALVTDRLRLLILTAVNTSKMSPCPKLAEISAYFWFSKLQLSSKLQS